MPPVNPAEVEQSARAAVPATEGKQLEHLLQSLDSEPDIDSDARSLTNVYGRAFWQRLVERFSQPRASAFMASLVVHVALFLALALWTLRQQGQGGSVFDFELRDGIVQTTADSPEVRVLSTDDSPAPPTDTIDPDLQRAASVTGASQAVDLAAMLAPRPAIAAASRVTAELDQLASASALRNAAPFASTGVEGRALAKRTEQALARGGTRESEQAVERALEWLARHQRPNGSWSLVHDDGECNHRCLHPGSQERFDTAATGLSLLAFLGAGYTHRDGKHRDTVRRGIYFLLQVRDESAGTDSYLYQSERGMYNHGIAAFAICEAYQMTGDEDLKVPAERAAQFIINAQSYQGGWGYLPKAPGDLTISGWQVMALKSSYASGFEVPSRTLAYLDQFLDSQTKDDVHYGYRNTEPAPTCTAIGMLLRMFRGRNASDPRILNAVRYLDSQGVSDSDVYFNYYATLAMFHVGGNIWIEWHPRVRDYLVKTQETNGHAAGSWYFDNPYGREGGRLYTTAMAAMTLEVYYRYAPLYQNAELPFEL
jgi:hypothetical protein